MCGVSPEERFQRSASSIGGSKIANRIDFHGPDAWADRELVRRMLSVGQFVSRLWARFGPPDEVGSEGFIYRLVDRETGLELTAYSAGSGPAYGGAIGNTMARAVLEAFERWIDVTPPVDCAIEYATDFGRTRSGARNGQPFDEDVVPRGADPRGAATEDECSAVAASWSARDPAHGGWGECLSRILAGKRAHGGEIVAVTIRGGDVEASIDDGRELRVVTLAPEVVRGRGRLWLRAFARR